MKTTRSLLLALAATAALPAPAALGATQTVTLDARAGRSPTVAGPVSGPRLERGRHYVVVARGTISYYAGRQYRRPVRPWDTVCGRTEPRPQFRSPGRPNGPVGMDAETVFARPWTRRMCARYPGAVNWGNFQISTGGRFRDLPAAGAPFTAPRADHTYAYVVRGRDRRVRFRLVDTRGKRDNYGRLRIRVRPAVAGDCATLGPRTFGAASEAACRSALGAPAVQGS